MFKSCFLIFEIYTLLIANQLGILVGFDIKKEFKHVIDWNEVDKEDYLLAIERSTVKDIEIKHLLNQALTNKINDRKIFMRGIDVSYYYEGYSEFKIEDL